MNIQEAKEEIIRTVRAYTARDGSGCWRIPAVRQRPVLLMGPPGIGKTAIMEQAAEACGVGLVAYTITHHTRQSAVGLPQLVTRCFQGREYTVTEYTMSEIVGAIYEYQERTGYREGILFVDEINCVSETLAPTMLQFLQYKTFGNHRVPEGWVIMAAGNPQAYNHSVRELDMAVLDRVRILNVEADYDVWKDYAMQRGVHPSVLSYLELHPEHFYQVTLTRDRKEFVTARGWEDLSVVLWEYERQGMTADGNFMEEFLRVPRIASDFSSWYRLCRTYLGMYRLPELTEGRLTEKEVHLLQKQLKEAGGDVRCMLVRHLLAAASEKMTGYGTDYRCCVRKKEVLGQFVSYRKEGGQQGPEGFLERRSHALQVRKENGLLKPWEERMESRVDDWLKELFCGERRPKLSAIPGSGGPAEIEAVQAVSGIPAEEERIQGQKRDLLLFLGRITDFLLDTFGADLEATDWFHGIQNHGDWKLTGYEHPKMRVLLEQRDQESQLRKKMEQMEELYETADRK